VEKKMKKFSLFLIVMFALGLTGCSKDAEINAFITEFESVTKEITSKIDASPNEAGVDAAQKAFDAKKASLKEKWAAIKDAVGFQVSADVKKKLEDSVKSSTQSLIEVTTKHGMALAMDEGAMPKFEKLMKDYQATFEMK
jgi:hypothetical protein